MLREAVQADGLEAEVASSGTAAIRGWPRGGGMWPCSRTSVAGADGIDVRGRPGERSRLSGDRDDGVRHDRNAVEA